MTSSLNALNGYWKDLRANLGVDENSRGRILPALRSKAREAAAMVASARLMLASGLDARKAAACTAVPTMARWTPTSSSTSSPAGWMRSPSAAGRCCTPIWRKLRHD